MSTTRSASRAIRHNQRDGRTRVSLHIADFLLPVSVCLWAIGVALTNVRVLGSLGLLPHLPLIFYAGVALLVVSAGAELAHNRVSTWRMAAHAVALVVMLYGTAPLLYAEPRYTWTYKIIGVVQYINANGHPNGSIDIYQNWPGFFALAAWFTKLAGLGSPLAYAKWAQLFYELAALPLLYLIYEALGLTKRQRWVAILLYSASNWIGQDYLSPQATGTLLSLGLMAIVMRWLYVTEAARVPVWRWLPSRRTDRSAAADVRIPAVRRNIPVIIAILLMYFVLTFTHELAPYLIAWQLGALAVVGALRPRWLPLALAAIAVGYLLPHFSFVSSRYGLLGGVGAFYKNAHFAHRNLSPSGRWIAWSADALFLGNWALAAVGVWLRRREGQDWLPLCLLTYSPVLVLLIQGYGHEGILRVFLFSLPWSASLAASALLPRLKEGRRPSVSQDRPDVPQGEMLERAQVRWWSPAWHRLKALRIVMCLGTALILFFPPFFGNDNLNVMPQAEVLTITSFFSHAAPGTILGASPGAPIHDTARYNQFPYRSVFGTSGIVGKTPIGPEIAGVIADRQRRKSGKPAYLVIAPSMISHSIAHHITPTNSFRILLTSLSHSPSWRLVRNRQGTVIYELPPSRLPSLPPGAGG